MGIRSCKRMVPVFVVAAMLYYVSKQTTNKTVAAQNIASLKHTAASKAAAPPPPVRKTPVPTHKVAKILVPPIKVVTDKWRTNLRGDKRSARCGPPKGASLLLHSRLNVCRPFIGMVAPCTSRGPMGVWKTSAMKRVEDTPYMTQFIPSAMKTLAASVDMGFDIIFYVGFGEPMIVCVSHAKKGIVIASVTCQRLICACWLS